ARPLPLRGPTRVRAAARPAPSPWTTSSSARPDSAGYCFVPDGERVRVNGGAAPRVLQGRTRRARGEPPAFGRARVLVPNPPGDPERRKPASGGSLGRGSLGVLSPCGGVVRARLEQRRHRIERRGLRREVVGAGEALRIVVANDGLPALIPDE